MSLFQPIYSVHSPSLLAFYTVRRRTLPVAAERLPRTNIAIPDHQYSSGERSLGDTAGIGISSQKPPLRHIDLSNTSLLFPPSVLSLSIVAAV